MATSRRKPVHPDCDGGILCPVEGHVQKRYVSKLRWKIEHIPLTAGQRRTLFERRMEAKTDV